MKNFILFILLMSFSPVCGQELDSIMQGLDSGRENQPIISTFKSPKLVLLQTNETHTKKNLTFWVSHRFGDIGGDSGGPRTLFGLDAATDIHLGFDYGITDELTVGIGRSRFNETYNLNSKYRLLQQKEVGMPVSVSLFEQTSWITRREFFPAEFDRQGNRVSHFFQVILARKFSPSLSLMVNPGYLIGAHITDLSDKENFFVFSFGGRLRITKSLSLIGDYTLVNGLDRPDNLTPGYTNPLGLGFEIQTGGHVFSLNFQNARFVTENNFIPNTQASWGDGEVRFGFTILRNFYLGPREQRDGGDEY